MATDDFMHEGFCEPVPISDELLAVADRTFSWLCDQYNAKVGAALDTQSPPYVHGDGPELDFTERAGMQWSVVNPYFVFKFGDALDTITRDFSESCVTIGEVAYLVARFPRVMNRNVTEVFFPPRKYVPESGSVNADTLSIKARNELRPVAGDAWLSYTMLVNRLPHIHKRFDADGIVELTKRYIETGIDVIHLQPYIDAGGYDTEAIKLAFETGLDMDILSAAANNH